MKKLMELNFMNDFKPSVHACTGDSCSGKTSYAINLILSLIYSNLKNFPNPSMEVKELSHLLNVKSNIFLFTQDSSVRIKILVNKLIENFPKAEQELLKEIFNHYVTIIDIFLLTSYEEINTFTNLPYPSIKYVFIDGEPNYKEEPLLFAKKCDDLKSFINKNLSKNFVFITSQVYKNSSIKFTSNSNPTIFPSVIQYAASSIVTLSKTKSKINCTVTKNRFALNYEEIKFKIKLIQKEGFSE